jgi:hypothetical protein
MNVPVQFLYVHLDMYNNIYILLLEEGVQDSLSPILDTILRNSETFPNKDIS